MTKTECPYCGHDQEEPEEAYEEDELYETECEECEKIYLVSPYYIKGYHEHKAPCKNGEEHEWYASTTFPRECTKMMCEYCDERRTPTEEEWKEILKEDTE